MSWIRMGLEHDPGASGLSLIMIGDNWVPNPEIPYSNGFCRRVDCFQSGLSTVTWANLLSLFLLCSLSIGFLTYISSSSLMASSNRLLVMTLNLVSESCAHDYSYGRDSVFKKT